MVEQLEPGLAVAGPLQDPGPFRLQRGPGPLGLEHRVRFRAGAARVQQFALVTASGQRLELELAVDVEQALAECTQRLQRRRLTVDPGARATVAANRATQDDLALVFDVLRREPRACRGVLPAGRSGR